MRLFEKGELKLLWPFYLDAFISPMLFFAPAFWVIYFAGIHFSFFQIGILSVMAPIMCLIFEIPTGAIADIYGRKASVLIGDTLLGIGYLLLFFFDSFWSIALVFAFMGIAATFCSGASEAWVFDLVKKKDKSLMHKYFSKVQGLDSAGLVVSGLIGALLVRFMGIKVIWIFGALSYLLAVLILLFAKEEFKRRSPHLKGASMNLLKQSKISVKYSRHHKGLFYFLITSAIMCFAMALNVGLSWIPYLSSLGLPDYAFGYMWSAMSVLGIASAIFSNKYLKHGIERKYMIYLILLTALSTVLVIFSGNLVSAFAVLLAGNFFYMAKRPAERVFFHKMIPSKLRATIGSVEGMLLAIIGIIAAPIAGLCVDNIGAKYTIFIAGLLMIPAAIVLYRIKEKK